MRILIIGSGAVGCFLGARLSLAGQQVTLVGRERLVTAVERDGLTLVEPSGSRLTPGVIAVARLADAYAAAPEGYDLTILTVKAYDTASAAQAIAGFPPLALSHTPVLTFQNGVGNEEILSGVLDAGRVLSGAIDTPVSIPTPGTVRVHRARFEIGLAPVQRSSALGAIGDMLMGAGFVVRSFDDYRSMKWTKLLMNILANASSAILDWTPARLMADRSVARLEALAWQEALAVMAAQGIGPVNLAGYPFALIAPFARLLPAEWLASLLRLFVKGGRGDKMPSLHIALSAGGRTEVPWLNGAVVKFGRAVSVSTPVNAVYTDVLMHLADGSERRERYRGRPDLLCDLVDARRRDVRSS